MPTRLLTCLACGGAVEVPETGGELCCGQCNTTHTWGPRPGPRATALPKPERTAGETDQHYHERRLAYLRKQEDEGVGDSPYATFDAPPGLGHLELAYDDPTLPGLLTEAFRRAIERCQETRGAMDAERNLFWIANKSNNVTTLASGDRRRGHAWLQTAREMIRDPGLQHILVCSLCDQARNDGDLEQARAILDRSDPTPWQLPLDSQYRTSAGMLALANDDADSALELVGERNGQVPFTESCVYQACFMRTAALEQTGRTEEAEAAVAFNLGVLPRELIANWLDGSSALAPVKRTLERVEAHGDDDDETFAEPDEELEVAPAIPASITAKPISREAPSPHGSRWVLWVAAAALIATVGLLSAWMVAGLD